MLISETKPILANESSGLRLAVLRTPEEIQPYRQLWLRLCRHRDTDPDFYDFVLSRRPNASAYVLLLETGVTQALVICRMEITKLSNKIGYFKIASPPLHVLEVIPGGILGDLDTRFARVVAAHISGLLGRAEVDMIRLHYIDVVSPLYVELARMHPFRFNRYRVRKTSHRVRQVRSVSSTFAESISRNERSNQRRREKRLIKEYHGNVRIEQYNSTTSLPRLLDDAERVASRSYQRGLGVGFASTEDMRCRLEFLTSHGWLSAWLLYLADSPAAFWIGALRHGVFSSDYLAYDSSYSHLAPGTYLTIKVMEHMHVAHSGVYEIDFNPGDAPYKSRFGTEARTVATVNMFALTWRGICANILDDSTLIAGTIARAALEKFDASDWFKRIVRRRAVKGS